MLKLGVLVSGGGTNLQAIMDAIDSGVITNAEVGLVISNNPGAYALKRAESRGIPAKCISPKKFENREEFHKALLQELQENKVELVVLAGFLVAIPPMIVEAYPNRIINIHPSLIPSFCGVGFYGLHVHEGVLARGVKVSGATVHFVDTGTDTGPIILQKAVEVQQLDLTSYMKRMEKSRGAYRTSVFQTENGYTVGVCVREDYVKTIMGYDMMYMHILMYGIIAAVCFVMIVYYLQYVRIKGRRKINRLTGELQQKQLLLEQEVEKNRLAEKQAGEAKMLQAQRTEKEVLDLESIPKNQYKFNFYLNASHAIYIDGTRGEVHPHTWEIVLHVAKMSSGLVLFNQVEKKVEEFLRRYQSRIINDFEPFTTINPTLENLTEFLLDSLQKELNPLGWMIFMIEVSETPARTYVMSLLD